MPRPHLWLRACVHAAGLLCAISLFATSDTISVDSFGHLADGRAVELYTLSLSNGTRVAISNYGAIIVRVMTADRHGKFDDIVLGYNRAEDYARSSPYFGAVVGRYANRIAHGRFTLDGQTYVLATNNTPQGVPCHLHGGKVGFDKVLWQAEPVTREGAVGLRLHYRSRDGEEGYPGNLDVTVHYWLQDDNALRIDYLATTDRATPVNLTNHSYFNLRSEGSGDILGHVLTIRASHTTKVGAGLIPTGELSPVRGTPLDFLTPHAIGERIGDDDPQLAYGHGYDQNWVLDKPLGQMALAAEVYEPESGRTLEVWTEEPGVQFYSGNFLDGTLTGKRGKAYGLRNGFCLETQHFPDSPNQANFPSTIVRPGQSFRTSTIYKFGTK